MERLNRFRDDCRILLKYSRDGIGILYTGSEFSRRDRNSLWHVVVLESSLQSRSVSTPRILLWTWAWGVLKSSCESDRGGTRILLWTWSRRYRNPLLNVVVVDACIVRTIREIKSTFDVDSYVLVFEKRSYLGHSHYDPRSNAAMWRKDSIVIVTVPKLSASVLETLSESSPERGTGGAAGILSSSELGSDGARSSLLNGVVCIASNIYIEHHHNHHVATTIKMGEVWNWTKKYLPFRWCSIPWTCFIY